jgi:E3 ubiquitin-protein ligase MYCBP2
MRNNLFCLDHFIFLHAGVMFNFISDSSHSVVRLELKGPDNSLRLRQIRVLGEVEGESLKLGHQHSAQTIQQRNCETETLRVFRLITSQVFGCH